MVCEVREGLLFVVAVCFLAVLVWSCFLRLLGSGLVWCVLALRLIDWPLGSDRSLRFLIRFVTIADLDHQRPGSGF